jgi:catechol 2,3-dioxygenase-like lactoylglutathione lyase family enzyme
LVDRPTGELGSEVVAARDLLLVTVGGRLDRSCQLGDTAPVAEAPLGSSIEATQILVVTDTERSRAFWTEVLGAELYRDYETSVVLRFANSWLLLVTGGDPTPDKPTVNLVPPTNPDRVSHLMTVRVQDCRAAYEALRARGAEFLTPPYDWGAEVRCFLRDPDSHLIELSEVT